MKTTGSLRSVLFVSVLSTLYCIEELNFIHFETQFDRKIKSDFVYSEVSCDGARKCAINCVLNGSCVSASYSEVEELCQLSKHRVDGKERQNRLTTNTSWITLSRKGCPDGWVGLGELCYYFVRHYVTYYTAKKYCEEHGGQLAEPRDNSTHQFLREYMNQNLGANMVRMFIGLTDLTNEGTYVWTSDGFETNYTAWGTPYTNNAGDRDCVVYYEHSGYDWNSAKWAKVFRGLCEM